MKTTYEQSLPTFTPTTLLSKTCDQHLIEIKTISSTVRLKPSSVSFDSRTVRGGLYSAPIFNYFVAVFVTCSNATCTAYFSPSFSHPQVSVTRMDTRSIAGVYILSFSLCLTPGVETSIRSHVNAIYLSIHFSLRITKRIIYQCLLPEMFVFIFGFINKTNKKKPQQTKPIYWLFYVYLPFFCTRRILIPFRVNFIDGVLAKERKKNCLKILPPPFTDKELSFFFERPLL